MTKSNEQDFELGASVSDGLSSFHGIVTGYAKYLYSVDRVEVQPEGLKDRCPISSHWF